MRPYRVFVFIACVMVMLGALCWVLPGRVTLGGRTLRWPTFAEVFDLPVTPVHTAWPDSLLADSFSTDTLAADTVTTPVPDTLPAPPIEEADRVPAPGTPAVKVDSTTDSRIFLAAFYAALAGADTTTVRVLHYGDSQIEEDRMTTQLRAQLQDRYGGAGAGLMPLVQTIPSRTVHQEVWLNGRRVTPQQGPRRYVVYASGAQRKDGRYGIMGQAAMMNDSLVKGSENIMAVCQPLDGRPRYSRLQVFADSGVTYEQRGDTIQLYGRGAVYGLSHESETGVIVDNIPMRGSLGTVFTKIDAEQLSRFCSEENVRLIILQFGGNALPYVEKPAIIAGAVKRLREQVRYLQECAPETGILFIGPSDMTTIVNGEKQTYPLLPYMDRLLRKMALEENIAYFSLFQWMGGSGSMMRWEEIGLAGKDGIHFTRTGARKAGNAVAKWLLDGVPNDTTVQQTAIE